MQKRKKQLLGLAGLALVAAITAVACATPVPEVAAVSNSNVPVRVQVGVPGDAATVKFLNLKSNSIITNKIFPVQFEYSNVTDLELTLTNAKTGKKYVVPTDECPAGTSTCTVNVDLEAAGLWNDTVQGQLGIDDPNGVGFSIELSGRNANTGSTAAADTISFLYRAAYLEFNKEYDGKNPIVYINMGPNVKEILLQATKDGSDSPLFNPALKLSDGTKVSYGRYRFVLPFDKYNLPAGLYDVIMTAFNSTDVNDAADIVSIDRLENIDYNPSRPVNPGGPSRPDDPNEPVNPDDPNQPTNPDKPNDPNKPQVPDTGSNLFGGLNISSADYIVTGLVAFGMVTAFAIFLIVRRSRR